MRGRCAWTGKIADGLQEVRLLVPDRFGAHPHEESFLVASEYEGELRRYAHRLTRYSRAFLLLMAGGVLASLVLALLGSMTGVAATLMGMGVVVLWLPFATPETVQMAGVRTSIRLARAGGLVLLALGAAVLLLA